MNYLDLFTKYHVAQLVDWFEEVDQMLVSIYLPHSGGSGIIYEVKSLEELNELIKKQTHGEIEIIIFKNYHEETDEFDNLLEEIFNNIKLVYDRSEEIMYFSVTKNRNYHTTFDQNKDKYDHAIKLWKK